MDKTKVKDTILTISTGFLVLYLLLKIFRSEDILWLLYVSLGTSLAGLLSESLALWIHTAWFWIADKIGWIMSRIILSLIFFFVLLPVGAVAKLFRKDFMYLKRRKDSYFIERNKKYLANDFSDPW